MQFRHQVMVTGAVSTVICVLLLTFLLYWKKKEDACHQKILDQLEEILIRFRENKFDDLLKTENHAELEKLNDQLEAIGHHIQLLKEEAQKERAPKKSFLISVRDNIILQAQVLRGFFRPFSKAQANKFADEYIKLLEIKTASADTPIKSLSGGNQQKVILARWLLTHPEYLILDEPTRGIDIGTKIEIQKLVLKLASEGMSVTFISSETDEMLRTCSRLIVMRDRRKVGEISGEDLTQSKIMDTIAGGEKKNG